MDTSNYPSPVNKLLTYGKPEPKDAPDWPNYLELGFGPEHISDLIRMAGDEELWKADEETPENWAPVHAWRTLGQLRATEAVEALLHVFEEHDRDDWAIDDLPQTYGLIGKAAIPVLEAYIADKSHEKYANMAESGFDYMVKFHPETKTDVVPTLMRLLERYETNDYELNAFLISSLVDLKAREALPLIERAFAADRVDESIRGDWDDVQVELGLKEAPPESEEPVFPANGPFLKDVPSTTSVASTSSEMTPLATPNPRYFAVKTSQPHSSKKAKNKMAKQSRKKRR
jgi:hypothetical protein